MPGDLQNIIGARAALKLMRARGGSVMRVPRLPDLKALSDKERRVIELLEHHGYREVADKMKIHLSTVYRISKRVTRGA